MKALILTQDHISAIVKTVTAHVAHYNEIAYNRRVEIELMVCESNSNVPINVDRLGRWHAPVDGYLLPDHIARLCECDESKAYGKGEFIPMPISSEYYGYSESFKDGYQFRVKSTVDQFDFIKNGLKGIEDRVHVSKGSVWNGDQCYIYFNSQSKGISNIIKQEYDDLARIEREKTEAEKAAKKALKGNAPVGKIAVAGKVLAVKYVENNYSYYANSIPKMLIELENGATVYGTVPAKIDDDYGRDLKGMVISFTANFEQAKDDSTHGYFKRPTKVSVKGAE